jgi:hypothetical protein
MKVIAWMGAFALLCTTWSVRANVNENVDYLLLTRENLPAPALLMEACLENLDFDPESYDEYMKKQAKAAWMPLVHVGVEVQENRLNDYNYVQNYQIERTPDDNFNRGQSFGGQSQTGYNDAVLLEAWAQWDLRDIVYYWDQQLAIGSEANIENERHFLYAEVSKRYGKLYSLLPDEPGDQIPAYRAVQLLEKYCLDHNLPELPVAISHADVCRPDLLFEIELDAVSASGG